MADDFTEQLNAVLGNPEAMGQIMSIARALTGDGNAAPPQAPPPQAPPPPPAEPEPLQAAPPADMDEAQRKLDSVQKLTDTISRYEQELTKMRKDADSRDRQQKDIRVRAAKAKQEYDQIKAVYDKEYKQDTAKLAEMKKNIEAEAAKQNPELLERYRSIKQHCTPPMARLADGQCCGCFMQLPSATLRALKEGTLVECDNCGRILYCEEE